MHRNFPMCFVFFMQADTVFHFIIVRLITRRCCPRWIRLRCDVYLLIQRSGNLPKPPWIIGNDTYWTLDAYLIRVASVCRAKKDRTNKLAHEWWWNRILWTKWSFYIQQMCGIGTAWNVRACTSRAPVIRNVRSVLLFSTCNGLNEYVTVYCRWGK